LWLLVGGRQLMNIKKKKKTVCGSLSLFSFLPLIFFVLVCLIPRKDIHT
jgi:hypothetical protein